MNCQDYIAHYLSADADGELTPDEERAVAEHLHGVGGGCAACRARLAEEKAVKSLIRRQAANVKAPEELHRRVRAALDEFDRTAEAPQGRAALLRGLRRPRVWMPLAAAAAIMIALFVTGAPYLRHDQRPAANGVSSMGAAEAFALAARNLNDFERGFEPNVPSQSLAAVAEAYRAADMPDVMWDFRPAGYVTAGGRLGRLPDGNPVTYTLYRGSNGDILCTRYKANNLALPPGMVADDDGHKFYRYKGYSLCLTVSKAGGYICVLTTRQPMEMLRRDVALSRTFSLKG